MTLVTNAVPPQPVVPPPLTFPRLMIHRHSGAVYLVARNGMAYSATCIHHGDIPEGSQPMPPEAIGHHVANAYLENMDDYGNTVYLQNERA